MRRSTFLLGPVLLFAAGYGLARFMGSGPGRPGAPAPPRPTALDEAWRAQVAGRRDEVKQRLAALAEEPVDDPRARDEVRLLRAWAAQDVATLTQLAEGLDVASRAVVAGAQRALALGAGGPAVRQGWRTRFARDFPDSWARAEVAAGEPR